MSKKARIQRLRAERIAVAARDPLPVILRDDVRTGKVRIEAHTLHFLGEDSVRAARVAAGPSASGASGRSSRRSTPARARRTRAA